jgi:hypothetical protein
MVRSRFGFGVTDFDANVKDWVFEGPLGVTV